MFFKVRTVSDLKKVLKLHGAYVRGDGDRPKCDVLDTEILPYRSVNIGLSATYRAMLSTRDIPIPTIPSIPNIHTTVYEHASQPCSLTMEEWHSCGARHCWAGWIVALAGGEGKALEILLTTPIAAMMILKASDPHLVKRGVKPEFYTHNEKALALMKELARSEKEDTYE